MKPGRISISSFRSALALGLVLWCAGAGCLAHGMAMAGSAANVNGKSAKATTDQSQMAMSGHACCKARHRALQQETAPVSTITIPEESSEGAVSCCPLTSGSFVAGSRSQPTDNHSELPAASSYEQVLAVAVQTDRAIPLRLPNHERTYLTCCVFLI